MHFSKQQKKSKYERNMHKNWMCVATTAELSQLSDEMKRWLLVWVNNSTWTRRRRISKIIRKLGPKRYHESEKTRTTAAMTYVRLKTLSKIWYMKRKRFHHHGGRYEDARLGRARWRKIRTPGNARCANMRRTEKAGLLDDMCDREIDVCDREIQSSSKLTFCAWGTAGTLE